MKILDSSGINPVQMQRQMQDKFSSADTDNSASLTLEEVTNATPGGTDNSRIEKMFSRMDSNNDGEVTQEERDSMVDKIRERLKSINSIASGLGSAKEESEPFDNLLKALADNETNGPGKEKITQLRDRMKQEGLTKENMQEAAYIVESLVPSISVKV